MLHKLSLSLAFAVRIASVLLLLVLGSMPGIAGPALSQHVVDFDGNGRTDYAVGRVNGSQLTWIYSLNPSGASAFVPWGLVLDEYVPEDYDGDLKTDIAVWRPGAPGAAAFFILQSQTNTVRIEAFGQSDDDPTVVGDYNNDGRADIAVYRPGSPSSWFFRTTAGGPVSQVQWGTLGDFPVPGDFNGDGSNDFVVQRNGGSGQGIFWRFFSGGAIDVVAFGLPNDLVVPGDYDGDAKTDLAVVRRVTGGSLEWYWIPSAGGVIQGAFWGLTETDRPAQGDYDGDGRTDLAIWRSSGVFWVYNSSNQSATAFPWGTTGDYPIANFNVH